MRGRIAALVASVGWLLVASGSARAEAPPARMQRELHTYFEGEKSATPLLVVPGLASIGVGTALLAADGSDLAKGVAYPTLALGVIELGVGLGLYLRTDAQVARLDRELAAHPGAFYASESKRVRGVRRDLSVLLWTEVAVTGVGVGLASVGAFTKAETVRGVGLGLAVQGTVLFLFDTLALDRATRYLGALEAFGVTTRADAGWSLTYGGRF